MEESAVRLKISPHAIFRGFDRSTIPLRELQRLIAQGDDIAPLTHAVEYGRLFWSAIDQRAYLAICNHKAGVVLTVMPAYRFDNGRFVGTKYIESASRHQPGVERRVSIEDVRALLNRQGRSIPPELAEAPTRYFACVRLAFLEAKPLMLRLGWYDAESSHSTNELLTDLVEQISRREDMPPHIVTARVEFRAKNATAPAFEIELDPLEISAGLRLRASTQAAAA